MSIQIKYWFPSFYNQNMKRKGALFTLIIMSYISDNNKDKYQKLNISTHSIN